MRAKPTRKPAPNRGRNAPGVLGRPKVDPGALSRAVAMVDAGTHTCEDAGEAVGLAGNTVRRAVKVRDAEAVDVLAAPVLELADSSEPAPPDLPSDVSAAIVSIADEDKARAVRRLVQGMGGTWDGSAVESLAATWGCPVGEVRTLMIEAAILAGANVLPPELAREESLAVARHARDKAKTAADWKSVLLAQAHIDGLQLKQREGEGLSKAQFVALARKLLDAVTPFPGAREAAIRVMFPAA